MRFEYEQYGVSTLLSPVCIFHVTDWFPPEVRPVHHGLYQTEEYGFAIYAPEHRDDDPAIWWIWSHLFKEYEPMNRHQGFTWRGIAK